LYTHRSGRTARAGKTGISISICHIKEKGKIREIERSINKQFEKGVMPSGSAICEKQLFNLVDQIEKVKVNEEEIVNLMPSIYRKLEWLDKEDIIKRIVSLEFNRMIDYYRDADDIEIVDERPPHREKERKGEWGGNSNRRSSEAEPGYTRFFLNFGKSDGMYPNQLIELVNKCVPGKVRIGRIELKENFSFFEVDEKQSKRVVERMNGFELDGRRVSVEYAQTRKGGSSEPGGRGGKRGGNDVHFYDRFDKRRGNNGKPGRRNPSERETRNRGPKH
jgi:ATP-dependent RNA helicase DeaD